MTNVADAELRGPDAGAAAWPSPNGAAPNPALPSPPALVSGRKPVDMPAPLVHEPALPRDQDAPLAQSATRIPVPPPTLASMIGAPTDSTDGTDDEPTPTLITGPAAILSPAESLSPVDDAAITLPNIAPLPAAAPAAAAAAGPELFMMPEPLTGSKPKKSGSRRFGKFMVLSAVVGGLGYAGATYGPDLYDQYIAEEDTSEPAAPLAFPRARTTAPEVRTATFVLEGLSVGSEASYTVTVDFETRVSRVAIDRTDAPDLEVLTFSNDALVRRLDSSSWYQMERGAFPFDDQLQKTDWIRMIDDLVPPERRAGVVIDASTESMVAGVQTRHLVLTLDPALLELVDGTGDSLDPVGDITDAAASSDPVTLEIVDDATVDGETPSPADVGVGEPQAATEQLGEDPAVGEPSSPAIETVPVAGEPVSANAVQVELWIDSQGVVRKSVGADVLGANSITLLETVPESWVPDYPDEQQVQPMTAAALLELGL